MVSPKSLIKACVVHGMGSAVMARLKLSAIHSKGALTILNLHRVCEHNVSAYEAFQPRLFDALLGWLKPRFQVLTFRDLAQFQLTDKPPLILSFDDGYLDFLDVAMPILAKHGMQANQNVVPGCIDSGKPPLNVLLQDFIGQAPDKLLRELELPGGVRLADTSDRMLVGRRASAVLKRLPISQQQLFVAGCQKHFDRLDNFATTPMMTLEQVTEAAKQHEIGVHSWDHASMSAETDAYLLEDAAHCREWLVNHVSPQQFIYAFPNGMANDDQAKLVRDAGFDHVLFVAEHFSRPSNWKHDRFTFHAQSEIESRFRAIGGTAWPNITAH